MRQWQRLMKKYLLPVGHRTLWGGNISRLEISSAIDSSLRRMGCVASKPSDWIVLSCLVSISGRGSPSNKAITNKSTLGYKSVYSLSLSSLFFILTLSVLSVISSVWENKVQLIYCKVVVSLSPHSYYSSISTLQYTTSPLGTNIIFQDSRSKGLGFDYRKVSNFRRSPYAWFCLCYDWHKNYILVSVITYKKCFIA